MLPNDNKNTIYVDDDNRAPYNMERKNVISPFPLKCSTPFGRRQKAYETWHFVRNYQINYSAIVTYYNGVKWLKANETKTCDVKKNEYSMVHYKSRDTGVFLFCGWVHHFIEMIKNTNIYLSDVKTYLPKIETTSNALLSMK